MRGSFPVEFPPPFVVLSCASQCWGLYGSNELVYFAANLMTCMYGSGMKVTQLVTGANVRGAWGQTGANTANFVESSLHSEGLLGAQRHLPHAGPFQKSARSCHWCYFSCSGTMCSTTGVSALPKSKSYLSANYRGICFFFCFLFLVFFALFPQDLMAISLQAFSPSPELLGWLCWVSPSLWSCTQVPVSCLRSYCQPFRTPSQGKSLHSYGSCLFSSHSFPPSSHSISFVYISVYPSFLSSLSCWLSSPSLLYSLSFNPPVCLSLL